MTRSEFCDIAGGDSTAAYNGHCIEVFNVGLLTGSNNVRLSLAPINRHTSAWPLVQGNLYSLLQKEAYNTLDEKITEGLEAMQQQARIARKHAYTLEPAAFARHSSSYPVLHGPGGYYLVNTLHKSLKAFEVSEASYLHSIALPGLALNHPIRLAGKRFAPYLDFEIHKGVYFRGVYPYAPREEEFKK